MKTIDRLTDSQVLALARFIEGCARIRSSSRWRTQFAECASRDSFLPFVSLADQGQLRELIHRRSEHVVFCLRTVDVLNEGNEVAQAYGEPPIVIARQDSDVPALQAG